MCTSLNQLMRIALLLTAIDAALVLFPVTAHAGSGFRRAIDAGVAGAKKVAVLVNIQLAESITSLGVRQVRAGVFSGAHLAFLITMDPRVTMDRHGPIHLGEGQAVALIGDDLGGVRGRTSVQLTG